MSTRSPRDIDDDHTDELPVLVDTVALGEDVEPLTLAPLTEDTAQHSLQAAAADAGSPEMLAELTERLEQLPALEAQIRVLTDGNRDLERALADKEEVIAGLRDALAAQRRASDEDAAEQRRRSDEAVAAQRRATEEAVAAQRRAAEEAVAAQRSASDEAIAAQSRAAAAQLASRDSRIAELASAAERLEREVAAHSSELERLRSERDAAHRQAESLHVELAAKTREAAASSDMDRLREDNAALSDYIAGRRAWWDEMSGVEDRLAARIAQLERELADGARRRSSADALAARESSRAVALRAELVGYARRAEELERELRLARAAAAQPPGGAGHARPAPAPEPAEPVFDAAAAPAKPAPAAPTPTAADPPVPQEAPVAQETPVLTDAVEASAPAVEALAQLEAEVEYKRHQVAAQLVELRDREQRLRATTAELEQMRRDLSALRSELDESRAHVVRLERAVIDKDRALEARDTRIATLHEELKTRLVPAEKRGAADLPLPTTQAAGPLRAPAPKESAADAAGGAALVRVTGDGPKRFVLTKRSITIGRAPHCDLQIMTHSVSREHARLTCSSGAAVIEDLGSRNGVFVNAVRVDRRQLHQGDLVTIGETQFRFVETMAH